MKLLIRLSGFLTYREKFLLAISVFIRVLLVTLDLAGIFLVGVVVSLISGTVIATSSPLFGILSWLKAQGFENGYAVILGVAIAFFIVKGALSFVVTYATATFVGRIEAAKARLAFAGLFQSSSGLVERFGRQDILNGLTTSMNSGFGLVITVGTSIAGELALLIGVSVYLALVNLELFVLVALFFAAVGLAMQASIGTLAGIYGRRLNEALLSSQETILDSTSNYKQLAIGDPRAFIQKFAHDRLLNAKSSAVYNTLGSLPRYITEIAVMVGVGILVMQRSSTASSVSAATVAVFLAGIFRIIASMLPLQNGLSYLKRLKYESELAFLMLESFPFSAFEYDNTKAASKPPQLVMSKVSFAYPDSPKLVLSHASFLVEAGSYCAIVGRSGAGKSTLVDLMLGFHSPTAGRVEIDGLSPKDYMRAYPLSIGYVPQSTTLISGSLLENITMEPGMNTVDQRRLDRALHMANIESLLTELPDGLESMLGPSGLRLSGGQSQRVGLARALYRNPKLLILDEATSALDDDSETAIRLALERLRGAVTILVIAHRPSTLKAANLVLKLNAKKVATFESYEAYKAS